MTMLVPNRRATTTRSPAKWIALAAVAIVLVGLIPESAWANHRHWSRPRVGVYIGGPLWWGYPYAYPHPFWYSPPPVYYYPPAPPAPPAPTVYVERQDTAAAAPAPQASAAANFWYYCRDPEGYYPYVKECKSPWEPVAPQPPAKSAP